MSFLGLCLTLTFAALSVVDLRFHNFGPALFFGAAAGFFALVAICGGLL